MSQQLDKASLINIPLYCYHSKFFLVEELALNDNFLEFHYGRCCLIGKIASELTEHYIENIRLPSLPEKYSLPEATVRLRIITSNLRRQAPHGKVCELVGEAILYDTKDPIANRAPLTSKDVAEQVRNLRLKNICESEYNKYLLSRYQPAVVVSHIKCLQKGAELAERNYEIKMLCSSNSFLS